MMSVHHCRNVLSMYTKWHDSARLLFIIVCLIVNILFIAWAEGNVVYFYTTPRAYSLVRRKALARGDYKSVSYHKRRLYVVAILSPNLLLTPKSYQYTSCHVSSNPCRVKSRAYEEVFLKQIRHCKFTDVHSSALTQGECDMISV